MDAGWDEIQAEAKWREVGECIEGWQTAVSSERDSLPISKKSSLWGDDLASHPYRVSTAVRMCINAAIDHLHATKVLFVDGRVVHQAALSTLARAALETGATGYWLLRPGRRDDRIQRTLQWYAQNSHDQIKATGHRGIASKSLDQLLSQVEAVAIYRGMDAAARSTIRRGYRSTTAVRYAEEHLPHLPLGVDLPWQLASGFAHGRPWASLGVQRHEVLAQDDRNMEVRLTSSAARSLYPNLAATQLVSALLALHRERAAAPFNCGGRTGCCSGPIHAGRR